MSEFDWSEKFPEMQPIRSAPSMFTMNGIGTSIYGSRDYDEETGTYVKTHAICLLFVPVIAIGAYRVADAPQGWYFVGKVPLSPFAKFWNLALILCLTLGTGGLFLHSHFTSPAYIAGQQLAEADDHAAAGRATRAAEIYRAVWIGGTSHASTAKEKLAGLVSNPPADLKETAGVFRVAIEMDQGSKNSKLTPLLFEKGTALVQQHSAADPQGSLAILEAIAPAAPDPAALWPQRRQLLEELVKQQPADAELASRLAVVCELQGELPRCEQVLTPHEKNLGEQEGARILGRIYVNQGKYEAAYALLQPYTAARLPKLHAAEQAFENTLKSLQDRVVNDLRGGKASGFDYNRYKSANQATQQALVSEYIDNRLKDHPAILKANQDRLKEAGVVPVALDLGIARLHRAQGLADPAARKAELEEAEKTFLAIRGLAGESDKYRMYLGQVYYWLGRPAEGKKLFDELLASQQRSPMILAAVAGVFREVGEVSSARALLEEAYGKETDQTKKYELALIRSINWTDLDDEIAWLGRANPDENAVKASLSYARGNKALQEGKDAEAATQLREAIAVYDKLPENAATLNNCALAYFSLYRATHDPEHFAKGAEKIDKAVALRSSDSILLSNAAAVILESATADLIGRALDLKALQHRASFDLLQYLCTDPAAKEKLAERIRKHPGVAKARSYYEKLLILAPKRPESYAVLSNLYEQTNDLEGLRSLRDRLAKAELDLSDRMRDAQDFQAGKKDDKYRADFLPQLARQEAVVKATRPQRGLTFAVAAATLAHTKLNAALVLPDVDANEVVALAQEAHQAAPSEGTHLLRVMAHCFRAHRTLAKEEPAYAALGQRCERSVGISQLVAYVL
ncbi:MAG: hypothetical protein JNM56_38250, partial [Planctomycetia bacterium]|nr:hypothetical protein [Planctomycetia bacterium]